MSLTTGVFPDQFKGCSVITLLKKYNLDKEELSNYIGLAYISHLSFFSKLTEHLAKIRLTQHLSSNNLLNKFQSVYTEHHSTESTLLAVHDHIIKFNKKSQLDVSWICLLPLIPSIILFSCIAYQLGLASMVKLSPGSHHTSHHVGSWLLSTQLLLLNLLSVRMSCKD